MNAALLKAASDRDAGKLHALLVSGANPNVTDRDGQTPIMRLVAWTTYDVIVGGVQEECVKLIDGLLRHGARIEARDRQGKTALMLAAEWDHTIITQALIDRGADINARDHRGRSVLTFAAWRGRDDKLLVQPLIERGAHMSLVDALLLDDERRASALAPTADLRDRGPRNETALMLAALWDDADVVRTLIARNADANTHDDRGFTAIMLASGGEPYMSQAGPVQWQSCGSNKSRAEIASMLAGAGANPNARESLEGPALIWAVQLDRDDVVRELLKHGADPLAKDAHGKTGLTLAKEHRNTEIERLLRAAGETE